MRPARSTSAKVPASSRAVTKRKRSSRSPPQKKKRPLPTLEEDESQDEEDKLDDKSTSSEEFRPPDDGDEDEESDRENDNSAQLGRTIKPTPKPIPKPGHGFGSGASAREAKDINHFFARGNKKSGEETICIFCRDQRKKDPKGAGDHKYIFSARTSNTSLRVHLEKHHAKEYQTFCKENCFPNRLASFKRTNEETVDDASGQPNSQVRAKFSPSQFVKHLVNFIVADDQSIRLVECREFRDLLLLLRPELRENEIPRRTKLYEEVMKNWGKWFTVLTQDLQAAFGRISLTADVWTDKQQLRSYICLTGHWIGQDSQSKTTRLRSEILAFHHLPHDSHDGTSLASMVVDMLDRAEITAKIGHLTLDNASVNEKMMEKLGDMLVHWSIPFHSHDNRIRCFPHVVNICVQHVLMAFENSTIIDSVPDTGYDSWKRAVRRKPIARLCAMIRALRASGKRREAFYESIRSGNTNSEFVDLEARERGECKSIRVPELTLLRDVDTRWDSVYHMIARARELRPAIENFIARNRNKNLDLDGLGLSKHEWAVLKDFEMILLCPHRVQLAMAKEATPILSGAIPSLELFMTKWESLAEHHANLQPFIEVGLDKAREYYKKMDLTQAYVVALVLNPMIKMNWIRKHWESKYVEMAEQTVKEEMCRYRDRNRSRPTTPAPTSVSNQQAPPSGNVEAWHNMDSQYGLSDMDIMSDDSAEVSVEDEYTTYILAPVSRAPVDLVAFWEMAKHQHPTFYQMAMDYLPIQASAVPCERAFSSGAETLTTRRNRINPPLMEALQMLKFSIKNRRLNFTQDWLTPEKLMDEPEEEDDPLKQLIGNRAEAMGTVLQALADGDR